MPGTTFNFLQIGFSTRSGVLIKTYDANVISFATCLLLLFIFIAILKRAQHCSENKNPHQFGEDFTLDCDLAGARTQDPLLKREMLYQLSYQVSCCGLCPP